MHKKIIIIIALLVSIALLSGCTEKDTCKNSIPKISDISPKYGESVKYFPIYLSANITDNDSDIMHIMIYYRISTWSKDVYIKELDVYGQNGTYSAGPLTTLNITSDIYKNKIVEWFIQVEDGKDVTFEVFKFNILPIFDRE